MPTFSWPNAAPSLHYSVSLQRFAHAKPHQHKLSGTYTLPLFRGDNTPAPAPGLSSSWVKRGAGTVANNVKNAAETHIYSNQCVRKRTCQACRRIYIQHGWARRVRRKVFGICCLALKHDVDPRCGCVHKVCMKSSCAI